MADFIDEDLRGSRFERADLTGATFERADLTGAAFERADLTGATFEHIDFQDARFYACGVAGATFRAVDLQNVVMRGVTFVDVDITGEIGNLTINSVEVGGLVNAELDRRHPGRAQMRPTDAAGFRTAWDLIERLWAETVDRARGLEPALLHESVDGEWSFIETLRHLAFATDSWIRRAMLGDPSPWHPLDLPWDEMSDTPGIPRDRAARPSLDEALELRHDRMATVRRVVDTLTDETLDAHTEPVTGPGWPEPRAYPVRRCLSIILNEEWEHRLYAERDLAVLTTRPAPS